MRAPGRAHVVSPGLIDRLRRVVSPPTPGPAGKWRPGGARRRCPKVPDLHLPGAEQEAVKNEGKEPDRDRQDAGPRHGKAASRARRVTPFVGEVREEVSRTSAVSSRPVFGSTGPAGKSRKVLCRFSGPDHNDS